MGPAGAGKTTIALRLAADLGRPFIEGDEHHPAANVEKMRGGIALDDDDRAPWLNTLNALLRAAPGPVILACSALTVDHRRRLATGVDDLRFVALTAPAEVLEARVAARTDHYMPPSLVADQLRRLEIPADAIVVDTRASTDEIVTNVLARLRHP